MNELIDRVMAKQRYYFDTKKTYPIEFRVRQLKKLKEQISRYEDELLEALTSDLGKSPSESYMTEVGLMYRHIDEMIKKLPKWGGKRSVRTPLFLMPARSYTLQVPYGNVLIMAPFNYPLLLTLDPLIGAIAGGNTAVVVMSEQTPATNFILETLISEAFSEDYLFFITGNKEINQDILSHRFDKIFFTGSQRVGKIVAKVAAENLTPITLELGGKSPVVVTKYADLETAAERVAWGKFLNAGQTCVAPDYCLVQEEIKKEFIQLVTDNIIRFYGQNCEKSSDYGRLINLTTLENLVDKLKQDKDYIVYGSTYNTEDNYLEPTLLSASLGEDLTLMEEEIFGPILPIIGYNDLEDALAYIKQKGQPLAFYPFSSDKKEIEHLLSSVHFGGATVNDVVLHLSNENLPFGGVGTSGMGNYHGVKSLEAFTHTQSVLKRSTVLRLPLMFPPFTADKDRIIQRFLK